MPFVTEEIYQMLPVKDSESIMISSYPKYNKEYILQALANLGQRLSVKGDSVATKSMYFRIPKFSNLPAVPND